METLLKELLAFVGPSGFEHDVARFIAHKAGGLAEDVQVDGIGNVAARVRGAHPGPLTVVCAHMDEVGFIVKKIEGNGLLRFEKLGGHDDRVLPAQRVRVRTAAGTLTGVIGTISAHMAKYDDAARVRGSAELYIDIGARDRAEALEMGVRVGDPAAWATEYERIGAGRALGKGFDDRAGCAVLLQVMAELDRSRLYGDVVAVFSVQEEVGLRGARAARRQWEADVALAVDTTPASDTPEAMMDGTLVLGGGPGIKVMDFSLIASRSVRDRLERVARERGIPHQFEVFAGIGTDGGEWATAKAGVPTGVLSIPSRYAHSSAEVIDLGDLEQTKELLKHFLLSVRSREEFSFLAR